MELSRVLWRCGVLNLAGVGCGGHRVLLPITGDGSGRERERTIEMQNRKHFSPKCGRVRTFFLAPELQQREITLEEKPSGTIKIYTLNKGEFKNPLPSLLATRAYTGFWVRNFPVFSASAFCSACGRVFVEWPARFDLKTPAGTTAGEDHVPRPSSSVHRSSLLP